jgi:hypothetical protein
MRVCVFDVEADDLDPTKIHCLVAAIYSQGEWVHKATTDYDQMRKFFDNSDVIIGHNISLWDIPVVERILYDGYEDSRLHRQDIDSGNLKPHRLSSKVIDTLALSWYLYPNGVGKQQRHGLDDWGTYFGVPKPKVTQGEWQGPLEDETFKQFQDKMLHRCGEDVKINCRLYDKQRQDLMRIYEDEEGVERLIDYLMFKMDCAVGAERSRWKLDVPRCLLSLDKLETEEAAKVDELSDLMPESVTMRTVKKPESMFLSGKTLKKPKTYIKANGDISASGLKFKNACEEHGQDPETTSEVYVASNELSSRAIAWLEAAQSLGLTESHPYDVEVEGSRERGNPKSHAQMKDWLFDIGWKPESFKQSKKKDEEGKDYIDNIPQLRVDSDDGKELCPSVKKLFKVEPRLEVMEGLTVLTHRIGILNGYMKNVDEDGFIRAQIQGFTNTLRFKHRTVVNLPSVDKPYGELVRGVLIAPEGYELCGSDMSALENRTRDHYIQPYDPDYVKTMMDKSYDPHLAIAVQAGFMTEEDAEFYKWYKKTDEVKTPEQSKRFEKLNFERQKGKTTNYSATYGAGGAKIAEAADISTEAGFDLHKAYWKVNWSIKAVSADQRVKFFYKLGNGELTYKTYEGRDLLPQEEDSKATKRKKYDMANKAAELWLWNPVSRLWYSLRYPKDIFSTLNQGTGVFAFDTWIKTFRGKRPQITGQMHDEVILCLPKGHREGCEKFLKSAIQSTNEQMNLNRELDIDVQFGANYAEIH